MIRRAEGDLVGALADCDATIEGGRTLGIGQQAVKQAIVQGVETAVALGEQAKAEDQLGLVESTPAGMRPPYLDAHARRFRGLIWDDEAGLAAAAEGFRDLGIPFSLAVTLLEHGEADGRPVFGRGGARDLRGPPGDALARTADRVHQRGAEVHALNCPSCGVGQPSRSSLGG